MLPKYATANEPYALQGPMTFELQPFALHELYSDGRIQHNDLHLITWIASFRDSNRLFLQFQLFIRKKTRSTINVRLLGLNISIKRPNVTNMHASVAPIYIHDFVRVTTVLGFPAISAGLMESAITVLSVRWRAGILYNGGESVGNADNPVERCHSQLPGRDYNFHNWYCTGGNMGYIRSRVYLAVFVKQNGKFRRQPYLPDVAARWLSRRPIKSRLSQFRARTPCYLEQQICYAMQHQDLSRENWEFE